jgi:hypothetical protein
MRRDDLATQVAKRLSILDGYFSFISRQITRYHYWAAFPAQTGRAFFGALCCRSGQTDAALPTEDSVFDFLKPLVILDGDAAACCNNFIQGGHPEPAKEALAATGP